MPQHDDEMKRRREKREAQRKKREAEARKLRRKLILAALVLVLCVVGIFKIVDLTGAGQGDETPAETQAAVKETTKPTEEPSRFQKDPITTIHIKAAGDLNVTDRVIDAGRSAVGFDFTRAFVDVGAIMADADLTVMNFEGNICGEPYGTATTSAPMELLQALRSIGVDILQTANSCAINNGLIGMTSTLRAIRSAGMEPVGSFTNQSEFNASKGYTIVDVKGIRIAFVAFTKGLGGMGMPAGNEDLVNLLYTDYAMTYKEVDKARIEKILKNVEAEKPDLTVAMLHWGSEYNDDISSTQKSIVSLMQKRGVDVILGTHPHTLQPIKYDASNGNFVIYSLGDFFGDAARGATNYSIILDLEITKDATTGTTRVTDYTYTPIYTIKDSLESRETQGDANYYRVVRVDSAMEAHLGNFLDKTTDAADESMAYALQRVEERLADTVEVTCPECEKPVEVFVNKEDVLVMNVTCACGNKLPAGSKSAEYK